MKQYHIFVSGQVQGVGFRWYCRDIARSAGIAGWVKNLPDGRVEIIVEGGKENIKQFLTQLKNGYLARNIKDVQEIEEEYQGESKEFKIIY